MDVALRILILHSRYRSGSASGENRVVEDEARLLTEAGHHVEVFAPGLGRPSGLDLFSAGLGTIWSRRAVDHVTTLVSRSRPDIVHCHNLFPALSPAVIRAIHGVGPVVMTLHNYRFQCLPATFFRDGRVCEDCLGRTPWPGVLHRCYQSSFAASAALASSLVLHKGVGTFRKISLYIAISEFVRRKHIEGGLSPDRIIVKPHFAWRVKRREGPGTYFLFLGRLSAEKGVDTLLHAWKQTQAKLLVVGDGPERGRLRALAPAGVEFRGTVEPDEVSALLRHARALVVPSRWYEGAGRVVLEAYAAGVPVLASRIGALPEVVEDGVTGLLLPPADRDSWALAAERILDDSESERMGEAAWRSWQVRFSPEKGLHDIENSYQSVLRSPKP
jgi:glycosyltransferase involved in cell wall biosynthesis